MDFADDRGNLGESDEETMGGEPALDLRFICATASAICRDDSDSGGVRGAIFEVTTACWMTEADGRRLDLPIVRGRRAAGSGTTGDIGGTGDDRAEDVSLSMPFIRIEGGREDGPEVRDESSSLITDFFILRNSAAEATGIPGLEDISDRSSNSLALGFFFLTVPPRATRSVSCGRR